MKFKKIAAVFGTFALLGATLGLVPAYSPNFTADNASNAVVYGASAAPSDLTGATKINDKLLSILDNGETTSNDQGTTTVITGDFSSSSGVVENEVILGSIINQQELSKIGFEALTDNKIPSLIDDKISWDDGDGGNSETSFNVHEEIRMNGMKLITSYDDNDLNATALTNNKDFEYRYVFDEDLFTGESLYVDELDNADNLKVKILGKEYDVEELHPDYVVISSSERQIFKAGESITIDDTKLTVEDIFEDLVQINGEFVELNEKKTIDGIDVYVEQVAYHSSDTLPSKVLLKVGESISTEYHDGEAYIGENEDDPMWVWTINNPGKTEGYIGVKYDQRQQDSEDDLVYVGRGYNLPENYGTVQFTALTDVNYEEFEVGFDELELYNATGHSLYDGADQKVLYIQGPADDSLIIDGKETNKIYLSYNGEEIDVFYSDVNDYVSSSTKPIFVDTLSNLDEDLGDLVYEDTVFDMSFDQEARVLTINGIEILMNDDGDLVHFGDLLEDAESKDVTLNDKQIGTWDNDVMDYYGVIVKDPESNADEDRVIFKVPSEQVYATIKVLGQGEAVETTETTNQTATNQTTNTPTVQLGSMIVKDTEIDSVKDRNLVVVGGSCINKVAAKLLGVPEKTCGADFTAKTNVGNGQFLVQEYTSPYNNDKVALLVAGYEAADTTAAVDQAVSSF